MSHTALLLHSALFYTQPHVKTPLVRPPSAVLPAGQTYKDIRSTRVKAFLFSSRLNDETLCHTVTSSWLTVTHIALAVSTLEDHVFLAPV